MVSQSDSLIEIVNVNSHTKWQTVQIQISWLLQKPTDLDLHCLQRQGISGFSRTRVITFFFSFLMDIHIIFFLCLLSEVLLMSTHNICNCIHPPIIMSWANNSVKHWWNLPISNLKPDLFHINAWTIWLKSLDSYSSYHPQTKIWNCLGHITLSKFDKICPLAIPNQISTISMHIPSMVKIHWCLLRLSSGNENMDVSPEITPSKLDDFAH